MSDHHQPGYGPPSGWQQPPPPPAGYGYPAGPGYGYGVQPPQGPSRAPAMWAHLGTLLTITAGSMFCGLGGFLGWIAPLAIRNDGRRRHDPYLRHHATQALNFGITQAIVAAFGMVLYFGSALAFAAADHRSDDSEPPPGLVVPLATVALVMAAYAISGVVCAVVATVKANKGELWNYPRLIAWPLSKG
ncbi:DUF4870 domain-containing protein [Streptomyces sp. NPDC093097]|uniref:DUF4870 domain-containing protein n=1 Tax=Streptomyces sp. NPDC093097 TaxID=3366027 RepID=UPI00382AB128